MSTPDTPATTLRNDEREALLAVVWKNPHVVIAAVERIVAARVAEVEQERSEWANRALRAEIAHTLAEAKVRAVEALVGTRLAGAAAEAVRAALTDSGSSLRATGSGAEESATEGAAR